jgi:hypothetical protein
LFRLSKNINQERKLADWNTLTNLTRNDEFTVTRVKLEKTGISIEGEFELPPLAKLSWEDQVFIAMFVKCHGSIKQMEKTFGVSYPTIKSRLNSMNKRIGLLETSTIRDKSQILNQLENGDISPQEAAKLMRES